MTDLIIYLSITAVGGIFGWQANKRGMSLGFAGKVQTVAIVCLILVMGMRMGSNEEIIDKIGAFGVYASIFGVLCLVLTIAGLYIVRRLLGFNKQGKLDLSNQGESSRAEATDDGNKFDSMTFIVLGMVAIGILFGYFVIYRDWPTERWGDFNEFAGTVIQWELYVLLLFVGIGIGSEGSLVETLKTAGLKILVFPAVTILMTVLCSLICSIILPVSLHESICIGCGFGWYTLAPGIMMDAGMVSASAIAFMYNVIRELLSIVFIPVVARRIGYIETTGMAGAAAMDVCLPICSRSTNGDVAMYSFLSGAILSALVPVLEPILVSL